jgi:hypothetical protein
VSETVTVSTTTAVSTAVESAEASEFALFPQENNDTLNTTASNKTNFFIFFLIKIIKQYFYASKTVQSYNKNIICKQFLSFFYAKYFFHQELTVFYHPHTFANN